ncbi:MAG: LCP family protein [Caldilineaceae bacterium]
MVWRWWTPWAVVHSAPQPDDVAAPRRAQVAPSQSDSQVAEQAAVHSQAINILLMGTDARPDEQGPPLTDTLILLSIDPACTAACCRCRDLWVHMPGVDVTTKINTAYRLGESTGYPGGGPQLIKDTVGSLVGQPVPYYARRLDGFVELVDLIGGVDVVVQRRSTTTSTRLPTTVTKSSTWMPAPSIWTARPRSSTCARNIDSDYGRARRQQQVINGGRQGAAPTYCPRCWPVHPGCSTPCAAASTPTCPWPPNWNWPTSCDNSLNEIPAVGAGQPLWRGNLQRGSVDLVPDRSRVRNAARGQLLQPGAPG